MPALDAFPDAHLRIFDRPPLPDPAALESVYLIGICGTGMGALAGLLREAGYTVTGADKGAYPPMSTQLEAQGIAFHTGYDPAHLQPAPDLVVVGNACTPTHPEATYAREQHLVQASLPETFAHLFLPRRRSLVVAGTHGKTTTTGLLTHVLQHAGRDPGFLVGGVMTGTGKHCGLGTGAHMVIEGDEYDSAYFDKRPKFMHYRPTCAIVTSMEYDHADIYSDWEAYQEAFQAFAATVPEEGLLVLHRDAPAVAALADHTSAPVRTYGLEAGDVTAREARPVDGGQAFTLVVDGSALTEIVLPMSGRHNRLNALAVSAVALHEGLSADELAAGLASFGGMKRRQEVVGTVDGAVIVDDFAHHPTAVEETLRAVAERWPRRRLVAVFEPRSNSSRRKVFESAYAEALARADCVFLSAPPLRHNDRPDDFLDAAEVANTLTEHGTTCQVYPNADALLPDLARTILPEDVVLVMSNGSFGGLPRRLLTASERS